MKQRRHKLLIAMVFVLLAVQSVAAECTGWSLWQNKQTALAFGLEKETKTPPGIKGSKFGSVIEPADWRSVATYKQREDCEKTAKLLREEWPIPTKDKSVRKIYRC